MLVVSQHPRVFGVDDIGHGKEPEALLRSKDRIARSFGTDAHEMLGGVFGDIETTGDHGGTRLAHVDQVVVLLRKLQSPVASGGRKDVGRKEKIESKDA